MPSISYAICAHNEHVELERLLTFLINKIEEEDEIVVQLDITATAEVRSVVDRFSSKIKLVQFHQGLNADFSTFKNYLKDACTKDYIFNIDADELPAEWLMEKLKEILYTNYQIEVFLVPRINTVEGLTEDHIAKWGWKVENGRINSPDYQWRIWKNKPEIKWINKVHEILSGYTQYSALPNIDELCLIHHKDIKKQEKQNELYDKIDKGIIVPITNITASSDQ